MKNLKKIIITGTLATTLMFSAQAGAEGVDSVEMGSEVISSSWASAKHAVRDIYETNRRIVKGAIQVWSFQGKVKADSFYNSIKDGSYNQFFEEKGTKILGRYGLNNSDKIMEGSENFMKKALPGSVSLGDKQYSGELLVHEKGGTNEPLRKVLLLHSQEMNLEEQLAAQELVENSSALGKASCNFWQDYPRLSKISSGKLRIGGVGALVGGLTALYFARRDYYAGEKDFEEAAAEVVYVVIKDGIVCYTGAIATDAALVATGLATAGGAPVIVASLVAGGVISMAINHAIDETALKDAVSYMVENNI